MAKSSREEVVVRILSKSQEYLVKRWGFDKCCARRFRLSTLDRPRTCMQRMTKALRRVEDGHTCTSSYRASHMASAYFEAVREQLGPIMVVGFKPLPPHQLQNQSFTWVKMFQDCAPIYVIPSPIAQLGLVSPSYFCHEGSW